MIEYFSLTQTLRIITPVVFAMVAFHLVPWSKLWNPRLGPPVFQVRIASGLFFLVVAVAATTPGGKNVAYYEFDLHEDSLALVLTVVFSLLANIFARRASANPSVQQVYPQLRMANWSTALTAGNMLTWLVYLFGYEFFFRGYLLFSAVAYMTVPLAIAVNLLIYSLAHSLKGWKEGLLSIPFGLLLCLLTLFTENIWCAFIIHASLALSNDWYALRRLERNTGGTPLTR